MATNRITAHTIAGAFLLLFIGFAPAKANDPSSIAELKRLTVEDLMNVEVTSVARHPSRLHELRAALAELVS